LACTIQVIFLAQTHSDKEPMLFLLANLFCFFLGPIASVRQVAFNDETSDGADQFAEDALMDQFSVDRSAGRIRATMDGKGAECDEIADGVAACFFNPRTTVKFGSDQVIDLDENGMLRADITGNTVDDKPKAIVAKAGWRVVEWPGGEASTVTFEKPAPSPLSDEEIAKAKSILHDGAGQQLRETLAYAAYHGLGMGYINQVLMEKFMKTAKVKFGVEVSSDEQKFREGQLFKMGLGFASITAGSYQSLTMA